MDGGAGGEDPAKVVTASAKLSQEQTDDPVEVADYGEDDERGEIK